MDEAPHRLADAAAALGHAAAQRRAGEVAECLAIAALCDEHQVDDTLLIEGAERWVKGGAEGTPHIGEFIAAEIAGTLQISIGAAFQQIATVLNLRHRHPRLWQALITGTVRAWQAAQVAKACDAAGLSQQACLHLDRHLAIALAQQPFGRIMRQLDGWIILADPAAAAEREQRAAARRHVSFGQIQEGHVPLWAQLDATDGLALDDAITGIADQLPDLDRDTNRAAALGILARHALGQEPLPLPDHAPDCEPTPARRPVEIIVHLTGPHTVSQQHTSPIPSHDMTTSLSRAEDPLLDDSPPPGDLVAHVRGWGHPRLEQLAPALAGSKVTLRPILNARHVAPVDTYQVPAPMRRALEARFPVDAFPYGTRDSRACDADHTIPFDHSGTVGTGQTRLPNLAPLSRFTHRLKTHGGWQLEQPQPGVLLWTSPLGYRYLVTPDGTTTTDRPPPSRHAWWRIEPPDRDDEPPEPPEPEIDAVELGFPRVRRARGPRRPALAA